MSFPFEHDAEPLLASLAQLFASEGLAREVAVLTFSVPRFEHWYFDNFDGGINNYKLILETVPALFAAIKNDKEDCQQRIWNETKAIISTYKGYSLGAVEIIPLTSPTSDWREKAAAFLSGEGVTNQGRVRSANVAPREFEGLLFRSDAEINLYKALEHRGIPVAPLPVFVRGGKNYRRIEPDFLIVWKGVTTIVEVDGDTFHRENPAEAHERLEMLRVEGVQIERVKADKCATPEAAALCASELIARIDRIKSAR